MSTHDGKQPRMSDADRKKAYKFAKTAFQKYGGALQYHQIVSKMTRKNQDKQMVTKDQFDISMEFLKDLVDNKTPNHSKHAIGTPISHALGQPHPHFMGIKGRFNRPTDEKDAKFLNAIVRLGNASGQLHAGSVMTSQFYGGPLNGGYVDSYKAGYHNANSGTDPVVVALVAGGKIPYVENRAIFSNMAHLVGGRSRNEFPKFLADYQLLLDMAGTHDSMMARPKQLWASMAQNCQIQLKLKECVHGFRTGNVYNQSNLDLDEMLRGFGAKHYDAPWMSFFEDEGQRLRKLMEVMFMRPAKISNLPYMQLNKDGFNNTLVHNLPPHARVVQDRGSVHVQIPHTTMAAAKDTTTNTLTAVKLFEYFKTPQMGNVNHVVTSYLPSLIYTQGMLVFYVNRRVNTAHVANAQFRYVQARVNASAGAERLNPYPIDTEEGFMFSDERLTHGVKYVLASMVSVTSKKLNGESNSDEYITGSKAWFRSPKKNANFDGTDESHWQWWCYDPHFMYDDASGQPVQEKTESEVKVAARTHGTIFIYAPAKDLYKSAPELDM